jgi:hypothetical protein
LALSRLRHSPTVAQGRPSHAVARLPGLGWRCLDCDTSGRWRKGDPHTRWRGSQRTRPYSRSRLPALGWRCLDCDASRPLAQGRPSHAVARLPAHRLRRACRHCDADYAAAGQGSPKRCRKCDADTWRRRGLGVDAARSRKESRRLRSRGVARRGRAGRREASTVRETAAAPFGRQPRHRAGQPRHRAGQPRHRAGDSCGTVRETAAAPCGGNGCRREGWRRSCDSGQLTLVKCARFQVAPATRFWARRPLPARVTLARDEAAAHGGRAAVRTASLATVGQRAVSRRGRA